MADYVCHLSKYMYAVGCESDNVDHFIGIVATIDLSATPPHHTGMVTLSQDVLCSPPHTDHI
jgi:hypothetical protein